MGGKGSAPPAPDYLGAATAQAQASERATTAQNFANRPTINTPFGSQTWSTGSTADPATGQPVTTFTQNTSLAPGLQSALDAQIGLQNDRSQLASGFMDRVGQEYAQPFDFGSLPQMAQLNAPSSLMTGLADYTPGLQTDVNTRAGQIVGGFNFGGPAMSVSPMMDGLARGVGSAPLSTQFSNLAGGIQAGVGQTPVDASFSSMAGDVQRGVANTGVNANFNPMTSGIQAGVGQTPVDTQFNSMTSGIQAGVAAAPVNTSFANMTGDVRRATGLEGVQRGLAVGDNPNLPQVDAGYRDQVAGQLLQRMQPVHDYQQQQLESRLANQGFTVGSEGYRRALEELQQRQAAERFNALDIAGNEAQRLFNMGMGARQQAFSEDVTGGQFANAAAQQAFNQGLTANQFANQATQQAFSQGLSAQQAANAALGQQFGQNVTATQVNNQANQQAFQQALGATQAANAARGQQFQQGLAGGQFANQANQQAFQQALQAQQAGNAAAGQQFGQNLAAGQFGNQAVQQAYAQALGATQAANAARGQQFQQGLAAGQFGNQANRQAFDQMMGAQQAGNQALGQQFQQGVTNANLNNQAINQAFGQNLAAFNFGNQAQQQAFNQNMSQAELANRAAGQQFNQDLQARQFSNQALGQAAALDLARMNAMNQAMSQQFGLNQQFADSQNRLRQQAIAEQMQRRGMSLNEMNALLSGQQVSMPQMPSFNPAGRAETPQLLQATQMGYDAQLGALNAQNAAFGNILGAGAQLGSAFLFSDRRLKRGIRRVGTHPIGVGIYTFKMMGFEQRGVIAQEVQRVRPDLVRRHASGYLQVDYGGL